MKNSKMLEMLEQNRIEELKAALRDEIFTESLKSNPTAKKRYTAMKRYLNSVESVREILKKPCEVEIDNNRYTAFCNGYSLALTREQAGEIKLCDDPDRYPPVENLLKYDGTEAVIDFTRVLAEAKSKGYKFKKSELHCNNFLMYYDSAYFRIALVDMTYGIIDDGKKAIVYHVEGSRKPLTITTDIGVCVVMPVYIEGDPEDCVIINA